MPPLLKLLKEGDTKGKEQAAVTFWNLTIQDETRIPLFEAGILSILLDILDDKESKPLLRQYISCVLRNLSVAVANRVPMCEAGIAPYLMALLKDGTDIAQEGMLDYCLCVCSVL